MNLVSATAAPSLGCARAIDIVRDVGVVLLGSLSPATLFAAVLESLERHFGLSHTYLLVLATDPDSQAPVLEVAAGRGAAADHVGLRVPLGVGLAGVAAQRRRPVRIGNMRVNRRYLTAMTSRDPAMAASGKPPLMALP